MASEGEGRILITEPAPDTPVPEATENEDDKMKTLSKKIDKFAEPEEIEKDTETNYYKPPTEHPYTKAVKYMEMHNVMQIFQHLTSEIVYHRPVDPLNYMLEELQRMKDERQTQQAAEASS